MNLKDKLSQAYNISSNKTQISKFENLSFIKKAKGKNTNTQSGIQKTAKLLYLLGPSMSQNILTTLSDEEIELISKEMLRIDNISLADIKVIEEESGISLNNSEALKYGPEIVSSILEAGIGVQKARTVLNKIEKSSRQAFDYLKLYDDQQLWPVLQDESALVLSVILPCLNAQVAAKILQKLSKEMCRDVIVRIANLRHLDREVLNEIEDNIKEKIRAIGVERAISINGVSALAGILRSMNFNESQVLIQDIEKEDENIAGNLIREMFSIDIVLKTNDRDLQALLRSIDFRDISLIIKGKSPELIKKIMDNISGNKKTLVLAENKSLGTITKSVSLNAEKILLDQIRAAWEAQKISFDTEKYIY